MVGFVPCRMADASASKVKRKQWDPLDMEKVMGAVQSGETISTASKMFHVS